MTEDEVMANMAAYEEGKVAYREGTPRHANPYTVYDPAQVNECQQIREDNWYEAWDREAERSMS